MHCGRYNFCLAFEADHKVYCYGDWAGCRWGANDCRSDSDCSKYTTASPKFTDGDSPSCPANGWRADACPDAFLQCTCLDGWSGMDCGTPPSPPPPSQSPLPPPSPSPPLPSPSPATQSPPAVCVSPAAPVSREVYFTLGISLEEFEATSFVAALHRDAIQTVLTAAISVAMPGARVLVTRAVAATSTSSVLFMQAVLPPSVTDSIDTTLAGVFADQASLLAALSCAGLSVPQAWLGASLSAPPPPLAEWDVRLTMELVLDMPFPVFQRDAMAYSPAVAHALGDAFGVDPATIWVAELRPLESRQYTVVQFDLVTPDPESESAILPERIRQYGSFFGDGDAMNTAAGDRALPVLMEALQRYGVPVTKAFYGPWRDPQK